MCLKIMLIYNSDPIQAFTGVAYSRFVDRPLYLEWAPMNCLEEASKSEVKQENLSEPVISTKKEPEPEQNTTMNDQAKKKEDDGAMLFVKNLNFKTGMFQYYNFTIPKLYISYAQDVDVPVLKR